MSTEATVSPVSSNGSVEFVKKHGIELMAWLLLIVYWSPAFRYFWTAWGNPDGYYSHGYLIPFMSGWTAWLKRNKARAMQPRPSTWAFGLLMLTLAAATVAGVQNSQTMRGLAFPVSLAFFVAVLYGWNFVKDFRFAIFYLYFLCPNPEAILTTLSFQVQVWSTQLATLIGKLFLIDAVRVGTSIHTDNVNLDVGTPCSGFRMLVALTAFAIFLVYAVKGDLWRKVLFVLIAMPLSVFVNSMRVAFLLLVGHYWDPTLVPVLHNTVGDVMLVVAFILMYAIARILGCREFRLME